MKLFDFRKNLKTLFNQHDIDTADADFIIAEILGVSRTDLSLIDNIDDDKISIIQEKVELRLKNMPVDKIFNKAYFYGLEFYVDTNVLTPRPESELIVDKAIEIIKRNNYKTALDMCTGSGCLAIAISKNCDIDMTAVDISDEALKIAEHNASNNSVDIKFVKSNMFNNVNGKFDIIISNPPYIESKEILTLDEEVKKYDPMIALDGGEDGLKFYQIIHDNLNKFLNKNGTLILEIGNTQKEMIKTIFSDCSLDCLKDYAGNDRVVIIRK